MNRFIPDSFLEGLWRPLAMAAPNGWVYLEIIAPDLRFLFMAMLIALSLICLRKGQRRPALWALAGFSAVAFVPWLLTTGNGRYFIPVLVLAGILCVGFAHALPFSRGLRFSLALTMIGLQGFAVMQNHPWNSWNAWGFHDWKQAPYYPVVLDAEAREQPATYVTLSVISYSLIAPQFAHDSRWINVSSLVGVSEDALPLKRANALLKSAERLRVVLPGQSMFARADGQPLKEGRDAVAKLMRVHRLRFTHADGGCRLLPMREESHPVDAKPAEAKSEAPKAKNGFWICEASYVDAPPATSFAAAGAREQQVFAVLEHSCPRLFPAGQTSLLPIPGGWLRHYAGADMKVYLFADGSVHYKYHRALNPVTIGTADEVLAPGFKMRCDDVPGRAGLPWERQI